MTDRLFGDLNNDTLVGGDGNDLLYGFGGLDIMIGGAGDDTYIVDQGYYFNQRYLDVDITYLDDSVDQLIETVNGGIDTVKANVDFTLDANFENLTLLNNTAEFDQDTLRYGRGVNVGHQARIGVGNSLDNKITGNDYDNQLFGMAGSDTLQGGLGSDRLDGGSGADIMAGGAGDDTYVVEDLGDQVVETDPTDWPGGIDTVESSIAYTLGSNIENLSLTGTDNLAGTGNELDNLIIGNSANNVLMGLAGNDTLNGAAGEDTLIGGVGNDALDGGSGADVMTGGTGDDTYYVDNVNDVTTELTTDPGLDSVYSSVTHTLGNAIEDLYLTESAVNGTGNALDNSIVGNLADNVLIGLAGNDRLDGGLGADSLLGGAGDDIYFTDNDNDIVIESVSEGLDMILSTASATLSENVENLSLLGDFATTGYVASLSATGNNADNRVIGNDGDNVLQGLAGNDFIDGRAGNDLITGGEDKDVLYGGDDAIFRTPCAPGGGEAMLMDGDGYFLPVGYQEILAANADVISGGLGDDNIDGGSGDDMLYGNEGNDVLFGGNDGLSANSDCNSGPILPSVAVIGDLPPGGIGIGSPTFLSNNDVLDGGVGDDILDGGSGDDRLFGGEGADNLSGGADGPLNTSNLDYLDGGLGIDTMAGGTGDDIYIVDGYSVVTPPPSPTPSPGSGGGDPKSDHDSDHDHDGEHASGDHDEDDHDEGDHDDDEHEHTESCLANAADDDHEGEHADSDDDDSSDDHEHTTSYSADDSDHGHGSGDDHDDEDHDDDDHDDDDGEAHSCRSTCVLPEETAPEDALDPGAGTITWVTDLVTENNNEGYDIVYASVDYKLTPNVEELHLTGTAALNGAGNALNNALFGNSAANTLDGGTGDDALAGGLGDDTYVIDSAGDTIIENMGDGQDTVKSTITYTLADGLENLTLTGTATINATGNALDNALTGNDNNNVIDAGAGDDILKGRKGNDTLLGGTGNDTYLYRIGDGLDVIEDTAGLDTISFGIGITPDHIVARTTMEAGVNRVHIRRLDKSGTELSTQGIDMVLNGAGQAPVESYTFVDGSRKTLSEMMITSQMHQGTENADVISTGRNDDTVYAGDDSDVVNTGSGNDIVFAGSGADTINGGGGNDTLKGEEGEDTLYGAAGIDVLDGGAGTDVLSGGCGDDLLLGGGDADKLVGGGGNDSLYGGLGNDVYLFYRGDQADSWSENDATAGNNDIARYGADITHNQLWFQKVGNDLKVTVIGSNDQNLIKDWYSGSAQHIERFESGNGKVLLDTQVDNLVAAMAQFAPPAAGQTTLPQNYQNQLNPVLAANWQ